MPSFSTLKETFQKFYVSVKLGHQDTDKRHRGHGFDHDAVVATLVLAIAPNERTATKAWCAALLHSTDRLTGGDAEQTREIMNSHSKHLPDNFFTEEEVSEIITAALRHDELNQSDQSLTQQVLMDADRLANLMLAVVIRAGQFRPNIPALEFDHLSRPNPQSTYKTPHSVLDNIRSLSDSFLPQLRIDKAKELGQAYAEELEHFVEKTESQYKDLGLEGISL